MIDRGDYISIENKKIGKVVHLGRKDKNIRKISVRILYPAEFSGIFSIPLDVRIIRKLSDSEVRLIKILYES